MQGLWVVIPAHNESAKLQTVIKKVKKYAKNIVVVDDGSKDNTHTLAKKSGVHALRHIVNLGKGAALKTGCDFALANKAKTIVTLDADAQHNPDEIPKFVSALEKADIVIGTRSLNKNMPAVLRFGNWFISLMTEVLYGLRISDTQSGYRAFRGETYKKIRWHAQDYSMESEMIANVGKHRLRYKTIDIETIYPDRYKGTTVFDGVKIVVNLVWWRLTRRG